MKIVFFVQSIISDWNHGNAHFLRGLIRALSDLGHEVLSAERAHNWSLDNLFTNYGAGPILEFARKFPDIAVRFYPCGDDLFDQVDSITKGADLVIVHEFNDPDLISAAGSVRRRRNDFVLLFHDTHHRAVSAPQEIARLDLNAYDGVLAFGNALTSLYKQRLGVKRAWTLHEAADTRLFYPRERPKSQDVVWIGNWGDDERSAEIRSYLIDAAKRLPHLKFTMYGVRYPEEVLAEMSDAGINYRRWIANFHVPDLFAASRLTVHIPRRYYLDGLTGIPTIRLFEALACGIPLISTFWQDVESLFRVGKDFLIVPTPEEMRRTISRVCQDEEMRGRLIENGLETIRKHHTCQHRANELLRIVDQIAGEGA